MTIGPAPPSITFSSRGIKSSDITPEELRSALELPTIKESQVAYRATGWRISAKNKAIINEDTGRLYGIFSNSYRLVPHEQGILEVMKAVEKNPEYGDVEWTVKDYEDSKRIRACGVFNDIDYEVNKELIHPRVEYYNSYDGSWAERLMFGAFRVICSNGAVIGEKFLQASAIHTEGVNRERMVIDLDNALHHFSIQTGIWKKWADEKLSLAHLNSAEEIGFSKENHDHLIGEVDQNPKMDLWSFYNIITMLITHRIASLNRQVRSFNRLRREQSTW